MTTLRVISEGPALDLPAYVGPWAEFVNAVDHCHLHEGWQPPYCTGQTLLGLADAHLTKNVPLQSGAEQEPETSILEGGGFLTTDASISEFSGSATPTGGAVPATSPTSTPGGCCTLVPVADPIPDPAPVPLPASGLLLMAGVALLWRWGR